MTGAILRHADIDMDGHPSAHGTKAAPLRRRSRARRGRTCARVRLRPRASPGIAPRRRLDDRVAKDSSGYFSFRLARAVPEGKVIALDVEPEMIRHIHHKAMTEGVRNLQVAFAKPDDPGIPAEADLVFMCDVLHHIQDRPAWLAKLVAQMHKGARLALVEFKEGKLPEGPPEAVKLSRAQLVALATSAGLALDRDKPDLLPYQTFLVFRKAR